MNLSTDQDYDSSNQIVLQRIKSGVRIRLLAWVQRHQDREIWKWKKRKKINIRLRSDSGDRAEVIWLCPYWKCFRKSRWGTEAPGGSMAYGCPLGSGDKFKRMQTHRFIVDIGVILIWVQFPLNWSFSLIFLYSFVYCTTCKLLCLNPLQHLNLVSPPLCLHLGVKRR